MVMAYLSKDDREQTWTKIETNRSNRNEQNTKK